MSYWVTHSIQYYNKYYAEKVLRKEFFAIHNLFGP